MARNTHETLPATQGVSLTAAGREAALDVGRRHRLLETYLAEAIGLGWDEVHDEAERLEHHLSDRLEARLDSLLGFPATDLHGDPIPRSGADLAPGPTLLETPAGQQGTVSRGSDRGPEQPRYLGSLGIVPGPGWRCWSICPSRGRCACWPTATTARGRPRSGADAGGGGAAGWPTPYGSQARSSPTR